MALLPRHPSDRLATAVLLFSATLWGLTWMPLKAFVGQGLPGPLVSLLTYGSVGGLAVALLWRDRAAWRAQWGLVLALLLVGGWANASFVNAVMLGDVARVMFLFYLSPVWSVLGGWLFLKEKMGGIRVLGPRRAGDPDSLISDPSRIKATVPWVPRHANLDEIVAHALQWERRLDEIRRAA